MKKVKQYFYFLVQCFFILPIYASSAKNHLEVPQNFQDMSETLFDEEHNLSKWAIASRNLQDGEGPIFDKDDDIKTGFILILVHSISNSENWHFAYDIHSNLGLKMQHKYISDPIVKDDLFKSFLTTYYIRIKKILNLKESAIKLISDEERKALLNIPKIDHIFSDTMELSDWAIQAMKESNYLFFEDKSALFKIHLIYAFDFILARFLKYEIKNDGPQYTIWDPANKRTINQKNTKGTRLSLLFILSELKKIL